MEFKKKNLVSDYLKEKEKENELFEDFEIEYMCGMCGNFGDEQNMKCTECGRRICKECFEQKDFSNLESFLKVEDFCEKCDKSNLKSLDKVDLKSLKKLQVPCIFCYKNNIKEMHSITILQNHIDACQYRFVTCATCGDDVLYNDKLNHQCFCNSCFQTKGKIQHDSDLCLKNLKDSFNQILSIYSKNHRNKDLNIENTAEVIEEINLLKQFLINNNNFNEVFDGTKLKIPENIPNIEVKDFNEMIKLNEREIEKNQKEIINYKKLEICKESPIFIVGISNDHQQAENRIKTKVDNIFDNEDNNSSISNINLDSTHNTTNLKEIRDVNNTNISQNRFIVNDTNLTCFIKEDADTSTNKQYTNVLKNININKNSLISLELLENRNENNIVSKINKISLIKVKNNPGDYQHINNNNLSELTFHSIEKESNKQQYKYVGKITIDNNEFNSNGKTFTTNILEIDSLQKLVVFNKGLVDFTIEEFKVEYEKRIFNIEETKEKVNVVEYIFSNNETKKFYNKLNYQWLIGGSYVFNSVDRVSN